MTYKKVAAAALVALMASSAVFVPAAEARRSRGYCDAYARDYASRRAGAQQVVGGAAVGALLGLGVGAVVGGHHALRDGALIGGGVGAVGGGINANSKWRKYYNRAYSNCRYGY
jgi:uncharacterized protein YcfJ